MATDKGFKNLKKLFHELSWVLYEKKNGVKETSIDNSGTTVKIFCQVLHNAGMIRLSQLPIPCIKGYALAIIILEDKYKAGLEECKNNLHGRFLLT
ncbi:hypothetical protein JHK86_000810 [Glycine max]|nr:hypothetical protein JHK86_000810 [Glycine max]